MLGESRESFWNWTVLVARETSFVLFVSVVLIVDKPDMSQIVFVLLIESPVLERNIEIFDCSPSRLILINYVLSIRKVYVLHPMSTISKRSNRQQRRATIEQAAAAERFHHHRQTAVRAPKVAAKKSSKNIFAVTIIHLRINCETFVLPVLKVFG